MKYYEIYAWTDCPYCQDAKELLIRKGQQFMFCCLDQSDGLLEHLKQKYDWATVPMIVEKSTLDPAYEKLIGGFDSLEEYALGWSDERES